MLMFMRVVFVTAVPTLVCLHQVLAKEPHSVDQIIDGIKRTERLLFESDSFLIRCRRTNIAEVSPTGHSGGPLRAEWVLARRGNRWFTQQRFLDPSRTKALYVPAEPTVRVVKDNAVLEWTQDNQRAVLDAFKTGGNIWLGWDYTNHLSLNVYAHIIKSVSTKVDLPASAIRELERPFLPEFLWENRDKYKVHSGAQEVDGVPCWVVEWPGMDCIWVDPEHGFAVRRRAYCWGPGKPLCEEVYSKDYRQVKPGLWLPFRQVVDRYANIRGDPRSVWGKVAYRYEIQVDKMEFDTLRDDFFDVRVDPGTMVTDGIRQLSYRVPAQVAHDPFEGPLTEAMLMTRSRYRFVAFVVGTAVVVGFLAAVYVIYRIRTAR